MTTRSLRTKVEEIQQAKTIHGGPLNLCAAALGVRLSRVPIPTRRLRLLVYKLIFGKRYSALNEGELERPLAEFPSFNALFTRGVRPECRPIAASPDLFLAPCDGTIQDLGQIIGGRILTAKGVDYSIGSLLPGVDASRFAGGSFAIIFLSPCDCHRVFSPQDARIEDITHVPGYRLLVHPPFQKNEYPVFTLNERILIRLRTMLGECMLVLVAGWGVGNITLPLDERFRPRARKLVRKRYEPPLQVQRGQWLATFELGSTVIILAEAAAPLTLLVKRDQSVRYGQPLFGPAGPHCPNRGAG